MTARQYMKLTWNAWRKSRTTYRQVKIRLYLYARKTRANQGSTLRVYLYAHKNMSESRKHLRVYLYAQRA